MHKILSCIAGGWNEGYALWECWLYLHFGWGSICVFEVICIENLSLHCISHLWGLLSFCSLLCTHLCLLCWDSFPLRHIHSFGERITKLYTNPFFSPIFCHHSPSFAVPFDVFLPILTTCCPLICYLVLTSISCKPHSPPSFLLSTFGGMLNCNQPVPEHQDFGLHFSLIDLVWLLWTEIKQGGGICIRKHWQYYLGQCCPSCWCCGVAMSP